MQMDDPGPGHSAERESSGQIGLSAHRKAYFFSLAVFLALWLAVYLSYSPVLSSTMLYLGGFSRAVSGFFHLTDAPAAVFSKLTRFGPFLIPRTIKLSEGNERIETYTIKRVEFDVQPSEAWFEQIRRKYFDRDPALRSANLGEPGVTPEKRARG